MQLPKRSVKQNATLNAVRKICSILFPIITFPYVTRVLQVENIGIYQFSYANISYFMLLAGLGIGTYAMREGVPYRENREQINDFANEIFSLNLLSTLVSYILLGLCLFLVPKFRNYRIPMALLSIEILLTTIGVEWLYALYEDYLFITIRSLVFQFLTMAALFVFVRNETDLYKYILITVIANAGSNTINFVFSKKYFDLQLNRKHFQNLYRHIRPVLIIFASSVTITIYVSSDVTMLGFFTNDYTVGLYTTATKVYTIIKNLISAVLVVTIPRFAALVVEQKADEFENMFNRTFRLLLCLITPAAVGMACLSREITYLAGGTRYLPGAPDLTILSAASVFALFAYLYTQCVLIPCRMEKVVLIATTISALVNIVLNFILIPLFYDRAAAITTVIAELITVVISYYYARGKVRIHNISRDLGSVAVGCIGIAGICMLIKHYVSGVLLTAILSVILSAGFYAAILLVFKNSALQFLFAGFLKKRNKES